MIHALLDAEIRQFLRRVGRRILWAAIALVGWPIGLWWAVADFRRRWQAEAGAREWRDAGDEEQDRLRERNLSRSTAR